MIKEKLQEKVLKLEQDLKQIEANYNATTGALILAKELLKEFEETEAAK